MAMTDEEVRELLDIIRDYLNFPSSDGKYAERLILREKMKEVLKKHDIRID